MFEINRERGTVCPETEPDLSHLSVSLSFLPVCVSSGQSLSVKVSPSSPQLLIPGNALTLLCSVSADNLPALALEVTWLLDGRDIITMERSGVVVSNSSSPSSPSGGGAQGRRGKVSLERTGAGEYRLGVRAVSGEDGGAYTCRVRAFVEKGGRSSGGGGRWHMAAEKSSSAVAVKVTTISECDFNFYPHFSFSPHNFVSFLVSLSFFSLLLHPCAFLILQL